MPQRSEPELPIPDVSGATPCWWLLVVVVGR